MIKYYLLALTVCSIGMIVVGFIRPYIVFHTLEEQGIVFVACLTAGFMFARALTSLYTGLFIKSRGYCFTGTIGLVLWTSVLYLYLITPSNLYPLIRVVEGFSAGMLWPTMQALVVHSIPSSWKTRGLSIYFIVGNVSYNFGVWFGGLVKAWAGVYGLFYSSIVLVTVLILVYSLATKGLYVNSSLYSNVDLGLYRDVFKKTVDLLPIAIVVGGIAGLSLDYLLAYAKELSGFSYETARLFWSYAGYLGLALSLLVSYVADKYGGVGISYSVAYIVSISLLAISTPLNPILLYTLLSIPVMGTRVFRPVIRGVAIERVGDRELGITYTNTLMNLGAGIAPLIVVTINQLVETNINTGVIAYSLASITTITMFLLKNRRLYKR